VYNNFIKELFPFLEVHSGRAILYLLVGAFCFDKAMGQTMHLAGGLSILCGCGYLVSFFTN
jgi:hypothetical protein